MPAVAASVPPWPWHQVPEGSTGSAKWVCTNSRRRARSAVEAKGTCVALLPQLGKQLDLVHQETQSSCCPASFNGGRLVQNSTRALPGRRTIEVNAASGAGFFNRVSDGRGLSSVNAETMVRADACVLTVEATVDAVEPVVGVAWIGSKYSPGSRPSL